KKAALFMAGIAVQQFQQSLPEEQEVVAVLSNLVIEVYAMESAVLRARKQASASSPGAAAGFHCDAARCYIHQAADRIEMEARRALPRIAQGDMLRSHVALLRRFLKRIPADTIELRRCLAGRALELGRYPF
ncbi:MAG: acyl-CoA dehydrogenase family protein, partial [Terriglobia bacterium]